MMITAGHSTWSAAGTIVVLSLLVYDGATDDHIDDPESSAIRITPKHDFQYEEFQDGANYSGLLYAGTVEFNWVVDIRAQDIDQEHWATGNLVTFLHVISTCRGIDLLLQETGDLRDTVVDAETLWQVDVFRRTQTMMTIHYCENYLWVDLGLTPIDGDWRKSGSRSVKKVIRHPQCSLDKVDYDVTVVVLKSPIPALEPRIGFMPTGFDYANEETKEMIKLDPSKAVTYESPLCYVASFGKNYVNHKELYVLDYKVKFRVYITKWKDCADMWSIICNSQCADESARNGYKGHLLCFRPRAKVGTVCDHDRGSPLVCNGQVLGLVVRGAKFEQCSNLFKIPFIVERLERYREFLDQAVKYLIRPVPRKEEAKTHARASLFKIAKTLYISSLTLVYLTHATSSFNSVSFSA